MRINVKQAAKSLFVPVDIALGYSGDRNSSQPARACHLGASLASARGTSGWGKGFGWISCNCCGLMGTGAKAPQGGETPFPKPQNSEYIFPEECFKTSRFSLFKVPKPHLFVCIELPWLCWLRQQNLRVPCKQEFALAVTRGNCSTSLELLFFTHLFSKDLAVQSYLSPKTALFLQISFSFNFGMKLSIFIAFVNFISGQVKLGNIFMALQGLQSFFELSDLPW